MTYGFNLRGQHSSRFLLSQHDGLVEPAQRDDRGRESASLSIHLHRDHFSGDDLSRLALADACAVPARLQ